MFEILGILYLGIAVVIWSAIAFYIFRVVALRKPEVDMWRDTLWNPFNLILMSSKLSREELAARKKLIALAIAFMLMTVIPLLFGTFVI